MQRIAVLQDLYNQFISCSSISQFYYSNSKYLQSLWVCLLHIGLHSFNSCAICVVYPTNITVQFYFTKSFAFFFLLLYFLKSYRFTELTVLNSYWICFYFTASLQLVYYKLLNFESLYSWRSTLLQANRRVYKRQLVYFTIRYLSCSLYKKWLYFTTLQLLVHFTLETISALFYFTGICSFYLINLIMVTVQFHVILHFIVGKVKVLQFYNFTNWFTDRFRV